MKCVRCDTDKDAGDFYAGDRTCKPCRRFLVRANRAAKIDQYREYDRQRAITPERMEHNKRVTREWRDKNPRERKCQVAVNNAVRDGRLFKWPACAVPECDSTRPVAHHPDYGQPLQVVWLCQAHHKQAHALTDRIEAESATR
jgi:hypothetical protein